MSCHERPYLSCIQPYRLLNGYSWMGIKTFPPGSNFSQTASIFSFASFSLDGSKITIKESDGLNLKYGPALMAMNDCPQSVNETTSQSPDGVSWSVVTLVTF